MCHRAIKTAAGNVAAGFSVVYARHFAKDQAATVCCNQQKGPAASSGPLERPKEHTDEWCKEFDSIPVKRRC